MYLENKATCRFPNEHETNIPFFSNILHSPLHLVEHMGMGNLRCVFGYFARVPAFHISHN